MSIVILFSCGILFFIDRRFNQLILPYIDIEVERLTNNIIQKEIHNFMIQNQYDDLFFQKNEQGDILYNSYQLSVIQGKITENLQDLLIRLDNGDVNPFFIPERVKSGRFHHIRKGILCDVSLVGQLNTEIEVDSKEYGINNILIQVHMIVKVKEQVSMPISSSQKEIIIKVPLIVQLIKGDVPNYYGRSTVK